MLHRYDAFPDSISVATQAGQRPEQGLRWTTNSVGR